MSDWPSNSACVELLSATPDGVLPSLDSVCRGPRPSEAGWVAELHKQHKDHPAFAKLHPKERFNSFAVTHFAGTVKYSIATQGASFAP